MSNIKPEFSRFASEAEHSVDANWKIDNDPPPIIMGIQSQFAHLQLLQSKVCKQKAEEGIRQVQESQKKQYASRMYAAEAQKLLAKAKRDGTTDVNKELEAFCKKNDIPFKKLEIQQGKANLFALIMGGIASTTLALFTGLCIAAICGCTGLDLQQVGKAIVKIIDVANTLASLVRPFLPQDLQLKLDSILRIVNFIKTVLSPFVAHTPQQRKDELAAIRKELAANPITREDLDAIFTIGKREGIFTAENAHRVAADMGIDLAGALTELESFGNDLAANQNVDHAWYEIEISQEMAEILLYPITLMGMLTEGLSYEEALKLAYQKTKVGEACDAANWAGVLNALEAMNAQETGRSQLLMVNINHHIGQYNSYLQGAMTAIANANQVNTAIAKGSG